MKVLTIIILTFLGSSLGHGDAGEMQAAVQEIFKEVLGFNPPDGRMTRTVTPPKHMLALYHKFISGKGKRSTIPGTVRNILPVKGPPSMADLLLFNVSCVDEVEEVRLGQLHLNRRRLHQRHFNRRVLAPPYRVRIYRVTGNRLSSLGSVPVPQANKAAWHAVDITSPLRELLLSPQTSHMLGIRFEAPRGKPLSPKHFLRETLGSSPSFLVIFSEESSENYINDEGEELKKAPPVHTHDLAMKIQSVTKGKWTDESNDMRLVFRDLDFSAEKIAISNNLSNEVNDKPVQEAESFKTIFVNGHLNESRHKRSVEDNELPELEPNNSNLILAKEHNVIPLPTRKKKGRKVGNSGKKKNKKTRSSSELWDSIIQRTTESTESTETCRLQKLRVSFADIGWDDWIIAPDTFEANYCTGSCSYPLKKDVRATNHATLQSIVHFLGKNIPPPSCAPDELSPAGFLFLDESGNTILKKYPNMRVEACSCR